MKQQCNCGKDIWKQTKQDVPRERFISALELSPSPGRVPHFELAFFLTMEAFGKVHPKHRNYNQWKQMSEDERKLHRRDQAELYVATAQRFEHDAIFIHPNPDSVKETLKLIDEVRKISDNKYFIMRHGDATYEIPNGNQFVEFSYKLADQPIQVKAEAKSMVDDAVKRAKQYAKHGGLDGFALCSDYCFNSGPFLSPDQMAEFIIPYLKELIAAYRDLNFYTIKHTDGNIMPILDQLVECNPHALHSIDPQGGVDIADVALAVGDKVALCGNVNCGLLTTGTDKQCIESARYALKHGMTAPGYIFSTSNCVFTGMELRRYELILDIWRNEGIRN